MVDRLGIGYDAVSARNPRVVYCSTSGYGQTGPHAQWAGHDLNYLAVGGFLDCTGRGDGGPPVPGATVADSAGGGMHAVMAILAALVRRSSTGAGAYLDVAAADGILGIMALMVDEYLATGAPQGPGTGLLLGRYACYDTYQAARRRVAGGRRHRAEVLGQPVPRCSGSSSGLPASSTKTRATRSAPMWLGCSPPATATTGRASSRRPTRASRPCCRSPRS